MCLFIKFEPRITHVSIRNTDSSSEVYFADGLQCIKDYYIHSLCLLIPLSLSLFRNQTCHCRHACLCGVTLYIYICSNIFY